jgi:DNA-binding transcriptional LysR family regulator
VFASLRHMPINELRAIATFAKAVELGSLRRAAQAQGISPQAASQAVAQLEQHLGVRLLHRTTRSLALTDEGLRFLDATQPALATLDRALMHARSAQEEVVGPLRIVGPRSCFAPILMPLLDEFCRQHPDVQPDVRLDDRIVNWVADRVDVGFRIGASPEPGVIGRRLFPMQLIVCAAPAYLERHGVPTSVEALAGHRCSVFCNPRNGQPVPWFLNCDGELVHHPVPPSFVTNDADLELRAVLAGQVVGQLANFTAAPYLRSGQLVALLRPQVSEPMGLHLYYGNRTLPRRVRAFIELAVARLQDSPAYVVSAAELQQMAQWPR